MRTADGPTTARFGLMRSGLASISGEGDVMVKHRRSPLSFHFSLYRGGWWVRRGGDGDGDTLANGKGNKNGKRWKWDVDVPQGSSVLEISNLQGRSGVGALCVGRILDVPLGHVLSAIVLCVLVSCPPPPLGPLLRSAVQLLMYTRLSLAISRTLVGYCFSLSARCL